MRKVPRLPEKKKVNEAAVRFQMQVGHLA